MIRCVHCKGFVRGNAYVTADNEVLHDYCVREFNLAKAGLTFPCPKCGDTGRMKHPTKVREYFVEVPNDYMCGPCDPQTRTERREEPVMVQCDLCGGHGRLARKPEPITKTEVVGWR